MKFKDIPILIFVLSIFKVSTAFTQINSDSISSLAPSIEPVDSLLLPSAASSDMILALTDPPVIARIKASTERLNEIQKNINQKQDALRDGGKAFDLEEVSKAGDASTELESSLQEASILRQAIHSLRDDESLVDELEYIEESIEMLQASVRQIVLSYPEEDLSEYTFEVVDPITDAYDCNVIENTTDKDNLMYSTHAAPLLAYTHPKLKPHFVGQDYLSTSAQVIKSGSNYFIALSIQIRSNRAKETFGGLEKGDAMRLQLINGETVIAYNMKRSFGIYDDISNVTNYSPVYSIKKDYLKKLSNVELDKVGLMWTTGYEDYEVYEIDFFVNHANCILGTYQ